MLGDQDPNYGDKFTVPDEQVARQAAASLAGHLFQAVRAATEWAGLGADERLLIEVAEDYAVLARGAVAMTQVKHEFSAPVTLRSEGVRKSIAGLIAFQKSNSGLKVSLAYLTTAEPGKEVGASLPGGATGIDYWRDVARGADIGPLRQLLLDSQTDDAVLAHIKSTDDDTLRATLVQRVSWQTSSAALPAANAALTARLRAMAIARSGYADDGERAALFIVYRMLQTAAAEDRVLTRDDFEREWQRATSVAVSFSMLRQLASMGGAGGGIPVATQPPPPPLSYRTAPRRDLVDTLRKKLLTADVLWLHGSSGLGKSQLARLMAARDNGRWGFVSLKDCDAQEQSNRIRNAIGTIVKQDFAGLILDDLPVPAPEGLRGWVSVACLEIGAAPAARIIVTSERPPLPQIAKAFAPLRIATEAAPYLEQADVEYIVTAAGGDASTWAGPIRLTCGGGHPWLVDPLPPAPGFGNQANQREVHPVSRGSRAFVINQTQGPAGPGEPNLAVEPDPRRTGIACREI